MQRNHVPGLIGPILLRRNAVVPLEGRMQRRVFIARRIHHHFRRDPRRSTLEKIQTALETAGIEFLSDRQNSPDGSPGLRLRRA